MEKNKYTIEELKEMFFNHWETSEKERKSYMKITGNEMPFSDFSLSQALFSMCKEIICLKDEINSLSSDFDFHKKE